MLRATHWAHNKKKFKWLHTAVVPAGHSSHSVAPLSLLISFGPHSSQNLRKISQTHKHLNCSVLVYPPIITWKLSSRTKHTWSLRWVHFMVGKSQKHASQILTLHVLCSVHGNTFRARTAYITFTCSCTARKRIAGTRLGEHDISSTENVPLLVLSRPKAGTGDRTRVRIPRMPPRRRRKIQVGIPVVYRSLTEKVMEQTLPIIHHSQWTSRSPMGVIRYDCSRIVIRCPPRNHNHTDHIRKRRNYSNIHLVGTHGICKSRIKERKLGLQITHNLAYHANWIVPTTIIIAANRHQQQQRQQHQTNKQQQQQTLTITII